MDEVWLIKGVSVPDLSASLPASLGSTVPTPRPLRALASAGGPPPRASFAPRRGLTFHPVARSGEADPAREAERQALLVRPRRNAGDARES
jgi:hypothetical protein